MVGFEVWFGVGCCCFEVGCVEDECFVDEFVLGFVGLVGEFVECWLSVFVEWYCDVICDYVCLIFGGVFKGV